MRSYLGETPLKIILSVNQRRNLKRQKKNRRILLLCCLDLHQRAIEKEGRDWR
jgi:hypothetical protein